MPTPNWLKTIVNRGKQYIVPASKELSLTEKSVLDALSEAKRYKQSQGYKDLLQRTAKETGIKVDPILLYFGSEKDFPLIKWMNEDTGSLGSYQYAANTLKLYPKWMRGREIIGTPLHEGFHWQRIGYPRLMTPKYLKWERAFDKGLSEDKERALWNEFYSDPYELSMLNARNAIEKAVERKTKLAVFDNTDPYLLQQGELQANGAEAGRLIGLNYFEPYPGYKTAKDAIRSAQEYNSYLKDIKSNTDKDAQNFWKILTGNYLPSITGVSIVGGSILQNKKDK